MKDWNLIKYKRGWVKTAWRWGKGGVGVIQKSDNDFKTTAQLGKVKVNLLNPPWKWVNKQAILVGAITRGIVSKVATISMLNGIASFTFAWGSSLEHIKQSGSGAVSC